MKKENNWITRVVKFCDEYNISYKYLPDTLNEPKVIPMIRGKAFEFTAMDALKETLKKQEWNVDKIKINAQLGLHDVDISVRHKKTKKRLSIECKLAKKESFKQLKRGYSEIRVKCMRSRTLGPSKVRELAPKLNIPAKVLAIHNDQYTEADFDIVITSIGNAFYRTDKKSGVFRWDPKEKEVKFLRKLLNAPETSMKELKKLSFEKLYVANSKDISIKRKNSIKCTRRKCKNKINCGFIPNYPIMRFSKECKPVNKWRPLSSSDKLFKSILSQ